MFRRSVTSGWYRRPFCANVPLSDTTVFGRKSAAKRARRHSFKGGQLAKGIVTEKRYFYLDLPGLQSPNEGRSLCCVCYPTIAIPLGCGSVRTASWRRSTPAPYRSRPRGRHVREFPPHSFDMESGCPPPSCARPRWRRGFAAQSPRFPPIATVLDIWKRSRVLCDFVGSGKLMRRRYFGEDRARWMSSAFFYSFLWVIVPMRVGMSLTRGRWVGVLVSPR